MSPPRTLAPRHSEQPLCIEYPGERGGNTHQILTRLYDDLEPPTMAEWPPQASPPSQTYTGGLPRKGGPAAGPRGTPRGPPLETHFDSSPQHSRSASYSSLGLHASDSHRPVAANLNHSFPCTEAAYISSSVTLPVQDNQGSFYQNVSGRMREQGDRVRSRTREEARASFARQAELHKSPRTQELEEFAAKFEGYQKQRTRRLAAQPTPMLDQLARETNNQFWLANAEQLSALETSLLRLVQRTDSTRHRGLVSDGDTSSGRESVTTVISNSSSDTLRQERHSSSETLRWGGEEEGEGGRTQGGELELAGGQEWGRRGGSQGEEGGWGGERGGRRMLYRSHSEAGALTESFHSPGAESDALARQWEVRHGEDNDHSGHLVPLQTPGRGEGGEDGWGGRERRVHCSYCLGRHTAQEECRAQEAAPSLTLPRRSGPRTRKPKLPTPPCSPPVPRSCTSLHTSPGDCSLHCPGGPLSAVLSSEARSCSTPSPPPPPPPVLGEGEEEFCHTGPLPPPPMDQIQPLECSTPPAQCSPTPLYGGKTPAATPKRDSPATIAAKEAPGWQMFLGVKSSTVSFTSEEASKFRASREGSRSRQGSRAGREEGRRRDEGREEGEQGKPEKRPKTRRQEYRQGRQGRGEGRGEEGDRELQSPDDKQQNLHLSRERSLKSISNWWRSSLEGGPTQPPPGGEAWGESDPTPSPRHNHSHSDSGISSMSGRSSCISPMSELSSSSGSSRTSLRSSSIVSASNILLEEEEGEEMEYKDLCKELLLFAPPDSRISGIIRSCLTQMLQVFFPEGSLEFEIRVSKDPTLDSEPSKRSRSTNFEDSRRTLLKHAAMRIETQRKHQLLLRESTKNNEEIGKEIVLELGQVAQQMEIDKVKLFTEEVDKITSLVIGLSSRLARSALPQGGGDLKLQRVAAERRDKLGEQLEEARKLRQSIFRRGDLVFSILARYLAHRAVEQFGGFIKEKIRLILETRQHGEVLKGEEEVLKCLKEYSANSVMII